MNPFSGHFKRLLLILGDFLAMFSALWLTLLIRHAADFTLAIWQSHWPVFCLLYVIWLPIFFAFNLYDFKSNFSIVPLITNLIKASAVNTVISIIFFYLAPTDNFIAPKTILAINIIILTILLFVWRRIFNSIIKSPALENNFIFIGWDPIIREVAKKAYEHGYKAEAIFYNDPAPINNPPLPILNNLSDLNKLIKNNKINLIVLSGSVDETITNELFQNLKLRINFMSLSKFYEEIFQKIPLSIINQGWFLENLSEGNKGPFELYKKFFDILLSLIIGLISLPFIPLIILAVALSSKGPVLFTQIRTGKDGQNFVAIKFRTMYQNAEANGPEWAKQNDPRVTKIGRLLRKTRIDEIPQLWNVLKGEMSFVGPRPERPEFIENLTKEIPFYRERLLVKPGLTGWAQILGPAYGGSKEETLEKLQYDLYYIKNRNFFLDLGIILKTLNTVLKGTGQ